jgi:hypothetical protein
MVISELEYTDNCQPNHYGNHGNIDLVKMGTTWVNKCKFDCDTCNQEGCFI